MKYIRFYQEFEDENTKKIPTGNVIAIQTDLKGYPNYFVINKQATVESFTPLSFEPNSVVVSGSVSREYLIENTKRISEEKARKIHPKLFEYLKDY